METKEEFCARMNAAQKASFDKFCKKDHVAKLIAHAPTPLHAELLRLMLSTVFDVGVNFGVSTMSAELENATRQEL